MYRDVNWELLIVRAMWYADHPCQQHRSLLTLYLLEKQTDEGGLGILG